MTTTSVGHELLNEIERVSAKRERWRGYAVGSEASFAPAIFLMTRAIDAAKAAIASGDAIACLQAYEDLKSYDSDD